MDHIKNSRERRRLNRNLENQIQSSFESENKVESSFGIDSILYPSNPGISTRKLSLKYSNPKIVTINKNRDIAKDDIDDEEDCHKLASAKEYFRRGSFSPEGTDENPSDHNNVKSKNTTSTTTLHKREKRRKAKRKRSNKDKHISSTRENDEENINENWSSMNRCELSSLTKKEYRDSDRHLKRKKDRTRGRSSHQNELPITEILRIADDNNLRNQYEEPVVLPQLTTDTIYIQGKNGFSAVKIPAERIVRGHRDPDLGETIMYPIKVAILMQKAWKNVGLIYQGLLAGMAFMHFLAIQTYFKHISEPIGDYSHIFQLYTSIFSFLVFMCIISAFDKFDLARLNMEHLREIYDSYTKSLIAIPLYITVFFLHQTTMKLDNKLTTQKYRNIMNLSVNDNNTVIVTAVEFNTWKDVTLVKDSIAVVAWIFIALSPQNDMLLSHLETLERYAQNNFS